MRLATTILVFCATALLSLGLVMLYSSGMPQAGSQFMLMQLAWAGLGFIACLAAVFLDYRHLQKFSWLFLLAAIGLLILVLIPPFGIRVNGAVRWLGYGRFRIQPSEFAKIALIIALAHYGDRYQRQMPRFWKGLLLPGAMIAVVLGLIFVEPDRGTTILLGLVSFIVLIVAGVRWLYIAPPAIAVVLALVVSFWFDPMRSERIYSWLHLEETRLGKGMQAYQAMVALGSGGTAGLGLGNSRQKTGFVPEHHTDFIFSIIGEELGLIATLGVLAAFLLLVASGIYISTHAADTFGLLLGCGITFLIGLQAFINIGVVTSALPNKGMPLPFISYGGSNLVVMLTGIGILLSIARRGVVRAAKPANPFQEHSRD